MSRIYVRTGISTIALALITMLSMSFVAIPVTGTGGTTPGPRMDLQIKAYTDPTVEFLGLNGNDIDLMDWPLDQSQIDAVLPPGDSNSQIALFGFAETGMFQVDLNSFCDSNDSPFHGDQATFNNATGVYCGLDPNTGATVPGFDFPRRLRTTMMDGVTPLNTWTSSVSFRQALAHLRLNVIDSIVTQVTQAKRLDNQVTAAIAGSPSDLSDNTQNYNQYNGGRLAAHNLLESIGLNCVTWNAGTLTCDSGPLTDTTTAALITPLRLFARSDDPRRFTAATILQGEFEAVGVDVDLIPVTSPQARVPVFRNSAFNGYTGGWIFVIDPDYIFDLYTYGGIFPVGVTSLTYGQNADQTMYDISAKAKFGATDPGLDPNCPRDDGNAAGVICGFKQALARHASRVITLPLYGNTAVVGARKPFWEGTNQQAPVALRGIVNQNGIGPGTSFWSTLNAYRTDVVGAPYGGTFRWGFKSPMVDPNPITSEWVWDALMLGALYDGGVSRDPYDQVTFRPWIYTPASGNAGAWSGELVGADYGDSGAGTSFTGGGSYVSFTIQNGLDLGGGLGNAVRFHPHGALSLPGPDNVYGTIDDVAVAAQPTGKVLTGLDVEASVIYVIDHVGFAYSLVSEIIDVKVCDSSATNCVGAGADTVLYTADDTIAPLGNMRRVEARFQSATWLARNYFGGLTIVPSDIWSYAGTPGNPTDDPIPNPVQFSARDPNNDGNQADHVLYGTGPWKFNAGFDITTGGTLLRNDKYFTPARTPVDPDVTGTLDITLPGGSTALGVGIDDVLQAGGQFGAGGTPYAARFDTDYDRDNDLDDLLITTVYFQFGNNPSNPALINSFRSWPDLGAG